MGIHFSKAKRNRDMLVDIANKLKEDIEFMERSLKIGASNNYLSALIDKFNQSNMVNAQNSRQHYSGIVGTQLPLNAQMERFAPPMDSENSFEEMLIQLRDHLEAPHIQIYWFSNAINGLVEDLGEYSKIVEQNLNDLLFIKDYYGNGPIGSAAIESAKAKLDAVGILIWGLDNTQPSGFTLEDDILQYMMLTEDRELTSLEETDEVSDRPFSGGAIYTPFKNLVLDDMMTLTKTDGSTIGPFPASDFKVSNVYTSQYFTNGIHTVAELHSINIQSSLTGETNIPIEDATTCYELFRTFEIYGMPHDKSEVAL